MLAEVVLLISEGALGYLGILVSNLFQVNQGLMSFLCLFPLFFSPGGKWNLELLNSLFDDPTVFNIFKLHWVGRNVPDHLVWLPTRKGSYTIKSAYCVKAGFNASLVSFPLWQQVWRSGLHERHILLIWRLINGFLLVRMRLAVRFRGFTVNLSLL